MDTTSFMDAAMADPEIQFYRLVLDNDAQKDLLADAFDSGSPSAIAYALGMIARVRGVSHVARDAGLARETLYRGLREGGDPKLTTLLGVIRALGLKLSVRPEGD